MWLTATGYSNNEKLYYCCPLGMRACTCVRVLYMKTIVYTFTKLNGRRIPKVRVGVDPIEFKLYSLWTSITQHYLFLSKRVLPIPAYIR